MVIMYVRLPLSLRNVEDLLFESGIDLCHEIVRLWWNRFDWRCQKDCTGSLPTPLEVGGGDASPT